MKQPLFPKTTLSKIAAVSTVASKGLCLGVLCLILAAAACKQQPKAEPGKQLTLPENATVLQQLPVHELPLARIAVQQEVSIGRFFQFIDGLVRAYDTLSSYTLSEHLLLRANPWVLDSLMATDYYIQKSRGRFVYDQRAMVVLKPGDTLLVPGLKTAARLLEKMTATRLDINIPAFEMRILEGDSLLFRIPVRVGKNQEKYLAAAGHLVDLRTRTGEGEIIRVNRFPIFIDPVTGDKFKFTRRDDRQTTLMPQIPWLEPSIDGRRYGQMIHPTTNPRTLGKPASNGCIGVSEADAWRLYYFAPKGTRVHIRYDLMEINSGGDTLRYEDIYQLRKRRKSTDAMVVAGFWNEKTAGICVCDTMF